MNDNTGGSRSLRRAAAVAVVALAAVLAIVLVTACESSNAPTVAATDSATPTYAQEIAFAQCIRSHGLPSFPNPDASGSFHINAATLDSSQATSAYGACRHLLPNGGPNLAAIQQEEQQKQAQQLPELLKWQQCVRSHGEPDFSVGLGGQSPAPGKGPGVNTGAPQFQAALNACQHLLPAGDHVSISTSRSSS